jgi:hypothetical protein
MSKLEVARNSKEVGRTRRLVCRRVVVLLRQLGAEARQSIIGRSSGLRRRREALEARMTEQGMTLEEEELLRQPPTKKELDPEDGDAEPAENFDQEPKDAAIVNESNLVVKVLDDDDMPPTGSGGVS